MSQYGNFAMNAKQKMDSGNHRATLQFQSMLEGTFAPADNSKYQNWSPVTQDRAPLDLSAGPDTSPHSRLNIVPVNTIGNGAHTASTSAGTGTRFADEAAGTGPGMEAVKDFILQEIQVIEETRRYAQPSVPKVSRLINSTLGTQAFPRDQEFDAGPSGSQPAAPNPQDAGTSRSGVVETRNTANLTPRWPVYCLNQGASASGSTTQSAHPAPIPEEEAQHTGIWATAGAAAADAPLLPYDRGRGMGIGGTDYMEDDNAMAALSRKRTRALGQPPGPAAGQDVAWYGSGNTFGAMADGARRPASPNVEDAHLLLTFSGGHQPPSGMLAPQDPATGFGTQFTQHPSGGSQPQWAGSTGPFARSAPLDPAEPASFRLIQAVAAGGAAAPPTAREPAASPPMDLMLAPYQSEWPPCGPSAGQLALLDVSPQPSKLPNSILQIPAPVEIGVLTLSQDGSSGSGVIWGTIYGVFDPMKYLEKKSQYIRLINQGQPSWVSRQGFERTNSVGSSKCNRTIRVLGPGDADAIKNETTYSAPLNPVPQDPSATKLEILDDWLFHNKLPLSIVATPKRGSRGHPRAQMGAIFAATVAAQHAQAANASDSAIRAMDYAHRTASRIAATESESEDGSQLKLNDNSEVNALAAELNAARITTTSGATSDTTPTYGAQEPSAGEMAAASPVPGVSHGMGPMRSPSWQTPSGAPSPLPSTLARIPGGPVYSPYARTMGAAGRVPGSSQRHASRCDDGIEHSCSSSSSASQRNGESEDAGHYAITPGTPGHGMPLHGMPTMTTAALARTGGAAASPAGTTCTGFPAGPASGTLPIDHDVSVANCATPTTSAARDTAGTPYNRAMQETNAVTSAGEGLRRLPASAMTLPPARGAVFVGYPAGAYGWAPPARPPHGPPVPGITSTSSSGPQSSGDTSSGSLGRAEGIAPAPGTSSLSQPPPHFGPHPSLPPHAHPHRRMVGHPVPGPHMHHTRIYAAPHGGLTYGAPFAIHAADAAHAGGPIRIHSIRAPYNYRNPYAPYNTAIVRRSLPSMAPTAPAVDTASGAPVGAAVLAGLPHGMMGHAPRMPMTYGQMAPWPGGHPLPGGFMQAGPQPGPRGPLVRARIPEGPEGGPQ